MKFKVKSDNKKKKKRKEGKCSRWIFFSLLPASSASHLQASGGSQRGNQVTANEKRARAAERERERKGGKRGRQETHMNTFYF